MKKLLSLTLALAMMLSMLAACGSDSDTSSTASTSSDSSTSSTESAATPTKDASEGTAVAASTNEAPDGIQEGSEATFIITADFIALQFPGDYSGGQAVYGAVYDPLFWSPSGEMDDVTGLLAESWEIADDYTSVTIKLVEGVYFGTGKELTAQDVIDSFDYHIEVRVDTMATGLINYEAIGEYEILLEFSAPNVNFMTELSVFHKGIFDTTAFQEMGAVVEAAYMCGSGPYYISDYAIGDYFILTAKEDHWNPERQAHIETVTCKVITNSTTAHSAMMAGEADVMGVSDYENMEQLLTVDGVNIVLNESPNTYGPYWLNSSGSLCEYLTNVRVREALSMMINVDELALVIGGGYGGVGTNVFTDVIDYEHNRVYDPEGGLAILAEEGIDPSDIVLTALCSNNATGAFGNLQSQFMECGITLNFIAQDTPAIMTAGFNNEWDVWAESGGMSAYAMSSPFNVLMGADAAFDVVGDPELKVQAADLVTKAFSSVSVEDQNATLAELFQMLDEQYTYLCSAYSGCRWFAFSDRLENTLYHWSSSVWMMWTTWIAE